MLFHITTGEILITPCGKCNKGHDESNDSCEDEYDGHGSIWSCTPPSTEYLIPVWTREARNDEELCEWTNHECSEWRSDILHRLPESKYSSLAFEGYHFLHDSLFTCLSDW